MNMKTTFEKSGHVCRCILTVAKVFLGIVTAVMIIALGLNITGVGEKLYGGELYRIITSSMEPTYMKGDYVVVEKGRGIDVNVGDVILFSTDDPATMGLPIAHRVKSIYLDERGVECYITAGDAAPSNDDSPVSAQNVIGKVIKKSYLFSVTTRLFTSPVFLFCALGIPLILILISLSAEKLFRYRHKAELEEYIIQAGLDPNDERLRELIERFGEDIIDTIKSKNKM